MIRNYYLNLSIKYKILVFFYLIIITVALVLGIYWTTNSEKFILSRVSTANLGVVKQLNSNLNFLKKDIVDISTYLCIDNEVLRLLEIDNKHDTRISEDNLDTSNSLRFIMNIIASKDYISCLLLYSNNESPLYYEFTDLSTGAKNLSAISQSPAYRKAVDLKGSPLWFPMLEENNDFIQNNKYPKIGVCRVIRDYGSFSQTGFLVIGINESTLRTMCIKNIQNDREGILITDNQGRIISNVGTKLYGQDLKTQDFYIKSRLNSEGAAIDHIGGKQYLVAYSSFGDGWRTYYAVPMEALRKEVNSVNNYTLIIVFLCLLFSLPLIILVSSLLTAPIKKLLKSMKRFQQGNFNERVEFKYKDEIGQLGEGYNTMVENIRELIDKAYVLQIKEHEAELNALQAQINPHFLYNTLDTIFWKAEAQGEKEISEMVYSLSKLFRLSLNRGKGSTLVAREKELIEHYLLLQKIRFKSKLSYEIHISTDILGYVIPKLILQPFVENSILHGLEGKENGGTVKVTGVLQGDKLLFIIEDDGIGIDPGQINKLFIPEDEKDSGQSPNPSGGYAVRNVNERLNLNFGENYTLRFTSTPGCGTRVEMTIPAIISGEGQEEIL